MKYKLFFVIGFAALILLIVTKLILSSVVVKTKDKLNIGFWGDTSYVVTLGLDSNQHTLLVLQNTTYTKVAGGYFEYKYGSLGALSKLEGNSQIIKKTLTLSSGVLLDGYFYDPTLAIYSQKSDEYPLNSIKSHLLSRVLTNVSDLNVLDKLYLYFKISSLRASNTNLYIDELGQNAVTYNAALRSERKLVQILYSKDYKSMFLLAKVLELTGVRVPDLTQNSETFLGRCQILENSSTPSNTAIYLKNYFNCTYQKQDLGLYEIVFKTGQQLENEWKVSK